MLSPEPLRSSNKYFVHFFRAISLDIYPTWNREQMSRLAFSTLDDLPDEWLCGWMVHCFVCWHKNALKTYNTQTSLTLTIPCPLYINVTSNSRGCASNICGFTSRLMFSRQWTTRIYWNLCVTYLDSVSLREQHGPVRPEIKIVVFLMIFGQAVDVLFNNFHENRVDVCVDVHVLGNRLFQNLIAEKGKEQLGWAKCFLESCWRKSRSKWILGPSRPLSNQRRINHLHRSVRLTLSVVQKWFEIY